ncbi:cellulose binding domain-containing protein [Nocardiopsis trehalosi]|jgi:hypothetical protein|uniref:cellulose binding domain-containing protein n=1 Tax=Nocardiopsis trehalosi TaxID=109329 RepID=UPI000833582E|nr:cellulose binding domain-containing protein [Nocardiopsis trehalosi]
MHSGRADPLTADARARRARGDRRGAHRAEPADSGPLATVGHVLESTVPKRVQPPRFLTVLLVSGTTLALTLFGYSTTQIYLRFSDPGDGPSGSPGASGPLDPGAGGASPSAPAAGGGDTSVSAVSYRTVESSSGTFTGRVTVTNTGADVLEDWELDLGFADARVTSADSVEWEPTDSGVVARPPAGSGGLAPGASVTVDFTAEGPAQSPITCSLNGAPCDL